MGAEIKLSESYIYTHCCHAWEHFVLTVFKPSNHDCILYPILFVIPNLNLCLINQKLALCKRDIH